MCDEVRNAPVFLHTCFPSLKRPGAGPPVSSLVSAESLQVYVRLGSDVGFEESSHLFERIAVFLLGV